MCPGSHCYFDYYQGNPKTEPTAIGGYITVEKVYNYDPMPKGLTKEEEQYIMGGQGNIWTEYISTPEHIEYMALPRMTALAEVLWTPTVQKNYSSFKMRLLKHFSLLDQLHVNYSKTIYDIKTLACPDSTKGKLVYKLSSAFNNENIRYTTDGSDPTPQSFSYTSPIIIDRNMQVKCAYYDKGKRIGPVQIQDFFITKTSGKPIKLKTPPHSGYPGDGAITLTNGIQGDLNRHSNDWLGFNGDDLEAEIDLGQTEEISKISLDALDNSVAWIYPPQSIKVYLSDKGKPFKEVAALNSSEVKKAGKVIVIPIPKQTARYIKVVVQNTTKIPDGQPGAGEKAWLFVDEIRAE